MPIDANPDIRISPEDRNVLAERFADFRREESAVHGEGHLVERPAAAGIDRCHLERAGALVLVIKDPVTVGVQSCHRRGRQIDVA